MTPERWKQIEAVFDQLLRVPEPAHASHLREVCNGDEELRREVESLLESHARAGTFIDRPSLFFSTEDLNEQDATISPGEVIGAYRVLREIGRGGMGAVYLAERADNQYEKQVAIKLIKRGMDTDSVLRHFRNERQILASFDHPNIARLFDGGTTDEGLPYFVMEYIDGLPIDQYCRIHNLSIRERLKLFREVCSAVSYAHRRTVIHRDIKTSNILVTSDGKPKLLDFGIAKILQPAAESDVLMTATGLRPMTPEYASPEQVRGEPVTTASDVYSLAVVLYELLTGRAPYIFKSRSPADLSHAITDTEPAKPSTAVRQRTSNHEDRKSADSHVAHQDLRALRGDVDNIVLMALRKEPARRYQSVEQLSEDIRRHLENRPVLARNDTIQYRARKFVRRNKAAVAAALLIIVSLIAGLIATIWQAHRATAERVRAEKRFNDVRQLAHSVLFDYHDAIKDLPGATRARERLVKDALKYLDSLAAESAGDLGLQRELAAAYERVGDVRGQAYAASLGDRAGAIDSYRKALNIREALAAASPRDFQSRRDLAASYGKLGNELLDTSEAGRGVEYLRKAVALSSKLADEQPANDRIRRDLAENNNALGAALQDVGQMAGALEYLRKALAIYETLQAADPRDRAIRRSLSVTYEMIGRTLFLQNDTAGALENNHKALALREALLAEDPTNADLRRILAISYQDNGDYRAWLKDIAGALESFRKKLAIDEQSVVADPANAQAAGDLAYSNLRIGELLGNSGDYGQAIGFFSRAADAYNKGAAMDQQNPGTEMRAAGAYACLGKAQAKLGNVAAAHDACGKASSILLGRAGDSGSIMAQRLRAIAFGDLAEAHATVAARQNLSGGLAAKDWQGAREMYQRSLLLLEDLQKRGILDAEEIPELDKTRQKIAACDAALKK